MTDVPEHLLRRSKAARDKAAGGTGDAGSTEAPVASGAAQASATAPGSEVATTAAAAPAVVEQPAAPLPPYVEAALRRPRVPKFAIPVLAMLPVWALVYAGTLTKPSGPADPELAMGQQVYAANCSSCHGAGGEGGTGRPLADLLKVFPNKADQILWVHLGSPPKGTPYGDPSLNRKAGQDGYTTPMPAFKNSLSDVQIAAVVRYERETFGKSPAQPSTQEDLTASGKTTSASGHGSSGGVTGTSQQSGATGTQSQGVTQPGNTSSGSNTNSAQTSGGNVGGSSGATQGGTVGGSGSNTSNSGAPAAGGGSTTQNGTGASGTSGTSKSGGGTGSSQGGTPTTAK